MRNSVSNYLYGQPLGITDCLIPSLAITHDARKLKGLRDPAAIFLPIQIDRQFHPFIIALTEIGVCQIGFPADGRFQPPGTCLGATRPSRLPNSARAVICPARPAGA